MNDPADLFNLRDIVLPPPVSLWPQTAGWWIVGAACLATAGIALARLFARHRRNAYRRAALRELEAIGLPDDQERAQLVSALLKRTALAAYPREDVAALTGSAWLDFLKTTGGVDAFDAQAARELNALTFGAVTKGNGAALGNEARRWIRRHKAREEGQC